MSEKIKLIAEVGWNHMGDLDLAKKMILAAKSAGADICKFQTWREENLKPGPWDTDGRREIYKKANLSKIQIKEFSSNFTKTLQIDSVDNAGFNGFEDSDDLHYIRFNEIEKANILVEF